MKKKKEQPSLVQDQMWSQRRTRSDAITLNTRWHHRKGAQWEGLRTQGQNCHLFKGGIWNKAYITIINKIKKRRTWVEKANQEEKSVSLKQNELSTWGRTAARLTRLLTIGSRSRGSRWPRVIRSALRVLMRCKRRRMYRAEVNSNNLGDRSSALGLPLISDVWI